MVQQFSHARRISGVYTITNVTDGLLYVGSASDVGERWYTHRGRLRRQLHSNQRLQAAWDACGEDSFHFFLVEVVADLSDLRSREQAWLDVKQSADPARGYNLMADARAVGFRFTDEQRARVSASLKGKKKSPEHRAAMRARVYTDEQMAGFRERMAAVGRSGRGKPKPAEHRRKIGEPQRGSGNHQAKLTENQVIEIKQLLARGDLTKQSIAAKFGVSATTVRGIEVGSRWGHLNTPSP